MRIVHLSRRRLLPALLLLLAALAAALFFALKKQSAPQTIYADGAAGCAAYLQKPDDRAERFADYTALQNAQGLPFASCGGQTVCRYTFRLTNYPGGRTDAQANLLLSGTAVIAGDVMLLGEDGGQFPLAYPK